MFFNSKFNYNMGMNMNCCPEEYSCPIIEKPVEKCIQKDIYHEVEHICPINTRIINNHIYKHVYKPQYSCCEENVYTNMDECGCAGMNFYEN